MSLYYCAPRRTCAQVDVCENVNLPLEGDEHKGLLVPAPEGVVAARKGGDLVVEHHLVGLALLGHDVGLREGRGLYEKGYLIGNYLFSHVSSPGGDDDLVVPVPGDVQLPETEQLLG